MSEPSSHPAMPPTFDAPLMVPLNQDLLITLSAYGQPAMPPCHEPPTPSTVPSNDDLVIVVPHVSPAIPPWQPPLSRLLYLPTVPVTWTFEMVEFVAARTMPAVLEPPSTESERLTSFRVALLIAGMNPVSPGFETLIPEME